MFRAALVILILVAGCSDSQSPVEDPVVADNEKVQNRGSDSDNWWDSLPRPEWGQYEKIDQTEDWFEV